jgi:hypothetical protein
VVVVFPESRTQESRSAPSYEPLEHSTLLKQNSSMSASLKLCGTHGHMWVFVGWMDGWMDRWIDG